MTISFSCSLDGDDRMGDLAEHGLLSDRVGGATLQRGRRHHLLLLLLQPQGGKIQTPGT
jgi:hypothetical protein